MVETLKNLLLNRITQYLTRGLLVAMAYLVGKGILPSDTAQHLGTVIVEVGAALFLLAWDRMIHSKLFTTIENAVQIDGATPATSDIAGQIPPGGGSNGKLTKTMNALMILLAMTIGAASLTACAQSETNRAAQGMILITTQAQTAKTLHDAGVTTPAQEKVISGLLHDQREAVVKYYDAIQAGDSTALAAAKASLSAASQALTNELAKYSVPPVQALTLPAPTPTTQP